MLSKNPKVVMQLGMLFLVIALVSMRFDHYDALNGFFIGLSIGLNLLSVVMRQRRRPVC